MAMFDNGWKGNILTGLAIGIGSAVLAPVLIPVLASVAKPLTKAAIKGGLIVFEKGKEVAAETREVLEDLVAEARSELAEAEKGTLPESDEGIGGKKEPIN